MQPAKILFRASVDHPTQEEIIDILDETNRSAYAYQGFEGGSE